MKKSRLILLQVFIVFLLICTSVYAAYDTTISLGASSTDVKVGGEVTVTLSLEDVNPNEKVTSVVGYINYNKDILETVTVDSIEKSSSNTVTIGNEELAVEDFTNKTDVSSSDAFVAFNGTPSSDNDIRIVIDFKNGITSDVDLLKIKFKVKSDANLGTVTNAIKYEMFEITAGSKTSSDITKNVNLTVVSAGQNEEPDNKDDKPDNKNDKPENKDDKPENKAADKKNETENKNTNKNTNTNKSANTNTNTNSNKNLTGNTNTLDNTVSAVNLPATGAKVIVIPAIVLIVLAYISYNKYMKYKNI